MMIYKKYGKVFRKIRVQEGLPLSFFAPVGISKSNLSDFENGKKMMSFDKVVIALQAMDVSLRRFEAHLNNYSSCNSSSILYDIEEAYISEDVHELHKLYELAKTQNLLQVCLSIKILLNTSTEDDLEYLINYLYSVEEWSYKELSVFYIVMRHISPKEIINILMLIKTHSAGIYHSKEYNRALTLVLCMSCEILSQQNYREQSKQILKSIDEYALASTMFLKTILLATTGVWIFHFDNKAKGKNEIKKALYIHSLAGFSTVTAYYERRYNNYITYLD